MRARGLLTTPPKVPRCSYVNRLGSGTLCLNLKKSYGRVATVSYKICMIIQISMYIICMSPDTNLQSPVVVLTSLKAGIPHATKLH